MRHFLQKRFSSHSCNALDHPAMKTQTYVLVAIVIISVARLVSDILPELKGQIPAASPILDVVIILLAGVLLARRRDNA